MTICVYVNDKLDFKKLITFTFHIVLQNDNPLASVSFDPDHLTMTCHKTLKENTQTRITNYKGCLRFHDAVICHGLSRT